MTMQRRNGPPPRIERWPSTTGNDSDRQVPGNRARSVPGPDSRKLDPAARAEILREIEERYPVHEWRVGGVYTWPIVRIRLGHGMASASLGPTGPSNPWGPTESMRKALEAVRHLSHRWDLRNVGREAHPTRNALPGAVFLADGVSFVSESGGSFDRTLDPLREHLFAANRRALLLIPGPRPVQARGPFEYVQSQLDLQLMRARLGRRVEASLPEYERVREFLDMLTEDSPRPRQLMMLAAPPITVGVWVMMLVATHRRVKILATLLPLAAIQIVESAGATEERAVGLRVSAARSLASASITAGWWTGAVQGLVFGNQNDE